MERLKKLFVFLSFILCVCLCLNPKKTSVYSLPQEAISLWIEGCELSCEQRYEHAQAVLAQKEIQENFFNGKIICLLPGMCRTMADCFKKLNKHEESLRALASLAKVSPRSGSLDVMPDRVILVPSSPALKEAIQQVKKINTIDVE